ncbi:DNA cytosine methyltransferase [Methylobacter sp.]|uniref:DNA cytosine methyltransferase n=1 Tax=Methylobacter sp. TaxID=2051955 RepID=UPI003DA5275C
MGIKRTMKTGTVNQTEIKKRQRPKLTAIDLFSGCGGLTTGLRQAGYKVLAAVEIDQKARETYALNHKSVWLAEYDIRSANPIEIMEALKLNPGDLDLLAGCPPCQGFSRMRKRNKVRSARDDRNALIDDFARFALVMRPKLIMMENVPGLADYYRFRGFKKNLENAGYQIRIEVLDVSKFGVAQRRKRLILSASRVGTPMLAEESKTTKTVRDIIGNLPKAGNSGDSLHDMTNHRRSERIQMLIQSIPLNGGSRTDLPQEMQLDCHKKSNGFRDVYGRMAWEAIAPTITGGCTNPSKGRFLHPEEHRPITLREAALLQGFPRKYKFEASHGKEAIALMIGNALPPPFIAVHARAMAQSIIHSI